MRRIGLMATVLLVAACSPGPASTPGLSPEPGAAGIGDVLYPGYGNGGYEVDHYDIDLDVDPSDGSVVGAVRLAATATQDLASMNLDAVALDVRQVSLWFDDPNTIVEPAFSRSGDELTIDFADPVASGTTFNLGIDYQATPMPRLEPAVPFPVGWERGTDGSLFVFSEPFGTAGWVPVNDHPADRATYSLSVDVPEGTIVVSSGEALDPVTSGGRTSYEFAFRDEMAAYQLPLAIGSFTVTEETVNGRRYWMALPDGVPRDVEASFAYQPEIVSLFEDRFGPYPFDQVGAIVVDTDLPASLETQAAPTYGLSSLDPDAVIIAHELAHQWFGNDVALEQWEDVWLNEGFATFAQLLWIEDHFGAAAYRSQVSSFYEYAKTLPAPAHPPADDLFGPSVYVRGALALVALRDSVGDDAIFSMLRHYVSDHAGRNVVTADFLELVSDDLEEGARPLVESFIDDASIPDLPVIS